MLSTWDLKLVEVSHLISHRNAFGSFCDQILAVHRACGSNGFT